MPPIPIIQRWIVKVSTVEPLCSHQTAASQRPPTRQSFIQFKRTKVYSIQLHPAGMSIYIYSFFYWKISCAKSEKSAKNNSAENKNKKKQNKIKGIQSALAMIREQISFKTWSTLIVRSFPFVSFVWPSFSLRKKNSDLFIVCDLSAVRHTNTQIKTILLILHARCTIPKVITNLFCCLLRQWKRKWNSEMKFLRGSNWASDSRRFQRQGEKQRQWGAQNNNK